MLITQSFEVNVQLLDACQISRALCILTFVQLVQRHTLYIVGKANRKGGIESHVQKSKRAFQSGYWDIVFVVLQDLSV